MLRRAASMTSGGQREMRSLIEPSSVPTPKPYRYCEDREIVGDVDQPEQERLLVLQLGLVDDQMIEGSPPALNARRDLRGQPPKEGWRFGLSGDIVNRVNRAH